MKINEFNFLCLFFGAACVYVGAAGYAHAYNERSVSNIKYRTSPHYEPQGGRLGVFVVKPTVLLTETYDDNIYRESDKKSDFITTVKPEVEISSDWSLHGIEAGASVEVGRYADFQEEDYRDYSFYLTGRYDLDYDTYIDASARIERRHQERDTFEDPGGDEPLVSSVKTVSVGFTRELGILRLKALARQQSFDHQNGSVGNTVIDNSERDRTHQELDLRVAYGLGDHYEVFGATGYEIRRYDQSSADFRDSHAVNFRFGAAMNITGKVRGDLYAGYIRQSFSGNLDSVGLFNYGGSMLWNISGLTSLEARAGRALVETVQSGASTIVQTTAQASLAHSFRENILGEASLGLTDNSYEGGGVSSRDSRLYKAGLSVIYKVAPSLSTGIRYDYLTRRFDDSARDYDNNKVMLTVRYAY